MQWLACTHVWVPVGAFCLVKSEEGDGSSGIGKEIPPVACVKSIRVTETHRSQATYS